MNFLLYYQVIKNKQNNKTYLAWQISQQNTWVFL